MCAFEFASRLSSVAELAHPSRDADQALRTEPASGMSAKHRALSQRSTLGQCDSGGGTGNHCVDSDSSLKPHAHARLDYAEVIDGMRGLLSLDHGAHL